MAKKPSKPQRKTHHHFKKTQHQRRKGHPARHSHTAYKVGQIQNVLNNARKRPAKSVGDVCGTEWPLAFNDERETCVAAAIGASILWATGVLISDYDLSQLGDALTLPRTLWDLAGKRFYDVALQEAWWVSEDLAATVPGLVVSLDLPDGQCHVAMTLGDGLVTSWGGVVPLRGYVREAWQLDWVEEN